MKLYKYFRVADEDDADINMREKYTLYAATTSKEDAKLFEKSRKKGYFLKKVTKANKKTCIDYLNKHRDSMLLWNELRTMRHIDDKMKHVVADVLMTESEYDSIIMTEDDIYPVLPTDIVNPRIFKQEYQNMLYNTGYSSAYIVHEVSTGEIAEAFGEATLELIDMVDIDQLVLYFNMIKDQLNPKGFGDIVRFL